MGALKIPETIKAKMIAPYGKLYKRHNHPLEIIKRKIYQCFQDFKKFEDFDPIVSVENNFDRLLIPKDHPSRSSSDTYYASESHVLRTHTSAHQSSLLIDGEKKFLVTGDVYRRDEIDRCHYPVFHQMEGVSICAEPEVELKAAMKNMVEQLFGDVEYKLVDSYFPFTEPSWELEIKWKGEWLEVAGMGIVHKDILKACNVNSNGWAFGLGLERLAMILFEIPDIRFFWSEDQRFLEQFKNGPAKFVPYSKYPVCYKDIAFWTPSEYSHNDFYELVREIGGDLVESVKLTDSFNKPGKGTSYCYRVAYQSMERTLSNDEVNDMQQGIRDAVVMLNVELR